MVQQAWRAFPRAPNNKEYPCDIKKYLCCVVQNRLRHKSYFLRTPKRSFVVESFASHGRAWLSHCVDTCTCMVGRVLSGISSNLPIQWRVNHHLKIPFHPRNERQHQCLCPNSRKRRGARRFGEHTLPRMRCVRDSELKMSKLSGPKSC